MQSVPVNPERHVQVKVWVARFGLQVAPFWQGWDEHGLLSYLKIF